MKTVIESLADAAVSTDWRSAPFELQLMRVLQRAVEDCDGSPAEMLSRARLIADWLGSRAKLLRAEYTARQGAAVAAAVAATRQASAARDAEIADLVAAGVPTASVAAQYRISSSRVREIARKAERRRAVTPRQ